MTWHPPRSMHESSFAKGVYVGAHFMAIDKRVVTDLDAERRLHKDRLTCGPNEIETEDWLVLHLANPHEGGCPWPVGLVVEFGIELTMGGDAA